jgi:hypothetical protein
MKSLGSWLRYTLGKKDAKEDKIGLHPICIHFAHIECCAQPAGGIL